MITPIWMWASFLALVLTLIIIDLGYFHKDDHEIDIKESIRMSLFYIIVALLFGLWIAYQMGGQSFAEYLTGYIIEKSLSLDNIFVISLIFSSLSIPRKYQHRVLFWGILGVIILRAIMITLGAELIEKFEWILYLFAGFMILTGIKMLIVPEQKMDIEKNPLLKWMRNHLNITETLHENHFIVKIQDHKSKTKKTYVTPLFVALFLVEFIDIIFAVDSVPAIFTITRDPFIVYTSNIFAILGLRALYFALSSMIERFHYLKYALALVLIFIGSKVFIADMLNLTKIPAVVSLGVTFSLLAWGCAYSIYKSKGK